MEKYSPILLERTRYIFWAIVVSKRLLHLMFARILPFFLASLGIRMCDGSGNIALRFVWVPWSPWIPIYLNGLCPRLNYSHLSLVGMDGGVPSRVGTLERHTIHLIIFEIWNQLTLKKTFMVSRGWCIISHI